MLGSSSPHTPTTSLCCTPALFGNWNKLLFTVAFSAVPLTLYIPPMRSLNLFVESLEDLARESRVYTDRFYPRVRLVWSRITDCMLCNTGLD